MTDSAPWLPPPPACAPPPGELHIWRMGLDVGAGALSHFEALLSPDEQARAARFVFARDRDHFVAARGFLRRLLGAALATDPAQLAFAYSAQGKPSLAAPAQRGRLCFNLAHSGDLALYALVWNRQVGIDVERIRADLPFRDVARSVFSPRELATLDRLPEAEGRRAFFTGWARKEAAIKARGDGLSYPLDRFDVSLLLDEAPTLRFPPDEATHWTLFAIDAGPGYAAAVVVEGTEPIRLLHFAA